VENQAVALHDVDTPCYNPGMGETKKPYPLRAFPSWAAMVKAQAEKETRPAGNLIERVMVAYCGDPAIQELVRKFEDSRSSSSD
jgi:hypothetical protein